ncbi:MAG: hypothetical protein KA801_13640 [Syntrophorhabdaceae bacterium]|nr:hypothetical protein [Syntrophorhabdaceae bacterium]
MNYTLSDFDNRLMNGFDFCKKACSLFEEIRRGPNGVERLRLRKDKLEKKLIEELLPIARYIQARYNHGRQVKVRWKDGNQNYDARILSSGALVDIGQAPQSQYVEVTTAVHENDHISRYMLNKDGWVFGAKGIKKHPDTGKYVSEPYVYTNSELSEDLATRILRRIAAKAKIKYPANTLLIIQCFLDTLLLEDEWDHTIAKVKDNNVDHAFREIFVFDSNHHYAATFYGNTSKTKEMTVEQSASSDAE